MSSKLVKAHFGHATIHLPLRAEEVLVAVTVFVTKAGNVELYGPTVEQEDETVKLLEYGIQRIKQVHVSRREKLIV